MPNPLAPRGPLLRLRPGDIQLYRACDTLSGGIILSMVVFGPWAFGTTQPWSIWTMNGASYLLGLLLAAKMLVRGLKGYHPSHWGEGIPGETPRSGLADVCVKLLAVLTVALVAWCFVSAVNARSTWHPAEFRFQYRDFIPWLPHSLDSAKSWPAFWNSLALACVFWGVRDWLLGKSRSEERVPVRGAESRARTASERDLLAMIPARLRTFLWVLAVNGALLGVEGIVQRLEGSGRLLFLVTPRVNPGAEAQFGPYAYRSNAAQYFNLLWPVCLGFWWTLNRNAGFRRKSHHLLLLCGAIMAVCPLMSTSRGGALITVGIACLAAFTLGAAHFLIAASRHENRKTRGFTLVALAVFFAATLTAGLALGWRSLAPRMEELNEGFTLREEMFDLARPMARDYPWFGTGPGTFETVFQAYRDTLDTYWPAQLHNDWLETRITFGALGSALIGVALLCVLARWFGRGGIHGGRRFVMLLYLALGGCLVHARFDFPFQIYSIVSLFLTLCAMLSVISRKPE